MNNIQFVHDSGDQATRQLANNLFMKVFVNPRLAEQKNQACLDLVQLVTEGSRLAFSTNSYVIDLLFSLDGNTDKLATYSTTNDIVVSGTIPRYLSYGSILGEGLPMETLGAMMTNMTEATRVAGIVVVTDDTKVVQRGAADKLFINTTDTGTIPANIRWDAQMLATGDVLLISGILGDHEVTILSPREQLGLGSELVNNYTVLTPFVQALRDIPDVEALHDAIRGGVNTIVHEFVAVCSYDVKLSEATLPAKPVVRSIYELLGLGALNFANENKLVIIAERSTIEQVLTVLHSHPLGENTALIDEAVERKDTRFVGLYDVKRTFDLPHTEPLPCIC